MSNSYGAPFAMGRTWVGESDTIDVSSSYLLSPAQHLEGRECSISDYDTNIVNANVPRSGDVRKTRIVRNCSGVTLYGGYAVTYSTPLKRVVGYSRLTAARLAGYVDPKLTQGVRDGDLFHLVVDGYVLTKTPFAGSGFGGDWAVGDPLFALTSAAVNATTTTQASIAGRMSKQPASFSATEATDGTAVSYARNTQVYAVSAATTAQTNADVLVYVRGDY